MKISGAKLQIKNYRISENSHPRPGISIQVELKEIVDFGYNKSLPSESRDSAIIQCISKVHLHNTRFQILSKSSPLFYSKWIRIKEGAINIIVLFIFFE